MIKLWVYNILWVEMSCFGWNLFCLVKWRNCMLVKLVKNWKNFWSLVFLVVEVSLIRVIGLIKVVVRLVVIELIFGNVSFGWGLCGIWIVCLFWLWLKIRIWYYVGNCCIILLVIFVGYWSNRGVLIELEFIGYFVICGLL